MKKVLLSLCFCLCFLLNTNAQESSSKLKGKMVYAEVGGPGVLFSLNFDSRFSSASNFGLGYRVGFGFGLGDEWEYSYYNNGGKEYYRSSTKTTSYITIPLGLNYVLGKPNSPHTFEVGIGATILTKKLHVFTSDNWAGKGEGGNFIGHATFMYRRQPLDGGFTWRAGLMPVLGTSGDIVLGIAAGIGYIF